MQLAMKAFKVDGMPLSTECWENVDLIHPQISLAIIIIKKSFIRAPMTSDVGAL